MFTPNQEAAAKALLEDGKREVLSQRVDTNDNHQGQGGSNIGNPQNRDWGTTTPHKS